jgi:hypothetical protein
MNMMDDIGDMAMAVQMMVIGAHLDAWRAIYELSWVAWGQMVRNAQTGVWQWPR